MQESTVTDRGQTTLPRDIRIRTALDLQPGDRIRYVVEGAHVRILPVRAVADLKGMLKNSRTPVSLDDMDAAVAQGASGSDQ